MTEDIPDLMKERWQLKNKANQKYKELDKKIKSIEREQCEEIEENQRNKRKKPGMHQDQIKSQLKHENVE